MKKMCGIVVAIVMIITISGSSMAADADLKSMSLDELVTLRNQITAEIFSRIPDAEPFYSGKYTAGVDIKEGCYTITNLTPESEDGVDTWIACTVRDKADESGEEEIVMDQYIHAGTAVTVNLTEGMSMNIRSSKSQMSITVNERPSWAP